MEANTDKPIETSVLVVGGSLVGLTTTVLLAERGVDVMMVERHPDTAIHPRAGHLHLRTLEIMREMGLESTLQKLSAERYFPNGCVNEVENLADGEIQAFIADLNEGVQEFSPSTRLFIAQDAIEPLLRAKAVEYGVPVQYSSEATLYGQDANGVRAVIRNQATGKDTQIQAQYVVAADGNRSTVRSWLGFGWGGYGDLSLSATIYFDADFRHLLRDQEIGVSYVNNEEVRGFFRFERSGMAGFLVVNTWGKADKPGALDIWSTLTEERATEIVKHALGDDSIDVKVGEISLWTATANVASGFSKGRVFLAGDAAHVVPPNGGFGGNTGIHDAHNLAWKLEKVLKGKAGEGLLETYDAERRPIGQFTIEQAYTRFRHRVTPELIDGDIPKVVKEMPAEIGWRYYSTAVIDEPDSTDDRGIVTEPREAHGRPGTRAAHFWQEPGKSSLDLFGRQFVLLTGRDGDAWQSQVDAVNEALGLDVVRVTASAEPAEFERLYGVGPEGASLVRPDGMIGWRSAQLGESASGLTLVDAMRKILDRP